MTSPGCSGGDHIANILPPDIQYSADTMFAADRREIMEKMDTLCLGHTDSLVRVYTDSLVTLELERIQSIRG